MHRGLDGALRDPENLGGLSDGKVEKEVGTERSQERVSASMSRPNAAALHSFNCGQSDRTSRQLAVRRL
jgi:hypothetical protein